MSGSLLSFIVVDVITVPPLLYASYWAFAIRQALASRAYRNHAMWLGVVCILTSLFFPAIELGNSSNFLISEAPAVVFPLLILVLFAWIDSTIPVARRSDPLLRSILHWEKLRIAGWIVTVLLVISLVISSVYPALSFVSVPALVFLFILGAPAVLIGARRSKDRLFRNSFKWFGAFLLLFLFLVIVGAFLGNVVAIPVLLVAAFFLYRSVRSLAPINRLSLDDAPKAQPPPQ